MKMKIPCKICRHSKKQHNPAFRTARTVVYDCNGCVNVSADYVPLHDYVQDNLGYVEQLAKKKGLV